MIPATTITHTISEPWRGFIAAALADIKSSRDEELRLLGLVHEARERGNRRRASLEETIRLLAREAELPDIAYTISPDGATITGEAPAQPTAPAPPSIPTPAA